MAVVRPRYPYHHHPRRMEYFKMWFIITPACVQFILFLYNPYSPKIITKLVAGNIPVRHKEIPLNTPLFSP